MLVRIMDYSYCYGLLNSKKKNLFICVSTTGGVSCRSYFARSIIIKWGGVFVFVLFVLALFFQGGGCFVVYVFTLMV